MWRKGKEEKENHQGRGPCFYHGGFLPFYYRFLSFFLLIFISMFFFTLLVKTTYMPNNKAITIAIEGAKKGVHYKEVTMEELNSITITIVHWKIMHCSKPPTLEVWLILEVWMFQTKLKIKRFGGSNPNFSFYFIFQTKRSSSSYL